MMVAKYKNKTTDPVTWELAGILLRGGLESHC